MKKLLSFTAIAAILTTLAAPTVAPAQDDGYGGNDFLSSDAEEFNVERPKKMKAEADDTSELSELLEFVPKNEIEIIPGKPEVDTGSGKKEAKKEDRPKAAGPKIGNTLGGRLGLGNVFSLGVDVGIGISDRERIDLGLSGGFGFGDEGFTVSAYEMTAFYDWRFKLSDDGALCVYAGPGIAFGSTSSWRNEGKIKEVIRYNNGVPADTSLQDSIKRFSGTNFGVGGQAGLDIDLSFIDPDHSLSGLRRSTVCVDFRPVFYLARAKKYPVVGLNFGVTWRFLLGKREE